MHRIGVARFWHESNSFSSVPTTIEDFVSYGGVLTGGQILGKSQRHDEIRGFLDVLSQAADVEVVPLVSAGAMPAGLITDAAAGELEAALRRELDRAGQLDGVCIALHGAISAESIPDFDGHVLKVIRERQGPQMPIALALDCHAIVTRQMIELSTIQVGYRTHPHVDLVETGVRCAKILVSTLEGRVRPTTRVQKIPLLLPPPDAGTHAGPIKQLFDRFIEWDRIDGVLACSLCPSFAWQDVDEQGWTAIAVTDGDADLARELATRLAREAWDLRSDLLPEPIASPDEAIRQAVKIDGGPVVITDSADTVGGGAAGDSTALLSCLLEMRGLIASPILMQMPDRECVQSAIAAGVGATISTLVGGKRDTKFGEPVPVRAEVLAVSGDPIHDDGGFTSEEMIDVGSSVLLGVDNVRLVLTERAVLGPQPSVFRNLGIEPFDAKIVALKTGVGYKATYGSVARAVIRADCPGAVSYNAANFDFERVPRPMFPLDRDARWAPPG